MGKPTAKQPSQLMELFLATARALGVESDRELAQLGDVTADNVANWKDGSVRELKRQTFNTVVERLTARIGALKAQSSAALRGLEVEEGASPTDLQRDFQARVAFDYVGHRFLYYEPQGALAWERIIGAGYDQDRWLAGIAKSAQGWLDTTKTPSGELKGPLARALGAGSKGGLKGLDVICLGVGDGSKEVAFLGQVRRWAEGQKPTLPWLTAAMIDVSIPLLLLAARAGRAALPGASVMPFCADFEEGRLDFLERLPSAQAAEGLSRRLVMILGNTFGNLRNEETFVRQKLYAMCRPGDLAWVEIALKLDRLEADPLYRLTQEGSAETAAEASRRILLEGPYRRWEAALGRRPSDLGMRIWVRQDDDSCRVPGSLNFCHDLMLKDEGRGCTMLYSRRYELEGLSRWFESLGFAVESLEKVEDSRGTPRVANLLLRRA
ncbi:MAG: L-histidine N(alpha)-methyltransferase [Myxococcaceae bacterium]|nr:L-histidine N(alpha)-methyltransferase [Myxococcaceae bacterium]